MENKVYVLAKVTQVDESEYRDYLNPMKARRYSRLMKRALVTALKAMRLSGVSQPDAIINGTALGSVAQSELLLDAMATEGEQVSMPTHFMQSTHNTVASLIAIHTGNHGYNSTYSHGTISYESALFDAFLQLKTGHIRTALVCANDELTPSLEGHLRRAGITPMVADRSWAVVLSTEKTADALCELTDIRLHHDLQSGDTAEIITQKLCD